MRIHYSIATYNLGELNTTDDNEAYAAAVESALEERFPGATVEVDLVDGCDRDVLVMSGRSDDLAFDDVEETCRELAASIWAEAVRS